MTLCNKHINHVYEMPKNQEGLNLESINMGDVINPD